VRNSKNPTKEPRSRRPARCGAVAMPILPQSLAFSCRHHRVTISSNEKPRTPAGALSSAPVLNRSTLPLDLGGVASGGGLWNCQLSSAAHVAGPTIPSTTSPDERWNARPDPRLMLRTCRRRVSRSAPAPTFDAGALPRRAARSARMNPDPVRSRLLVYGGCRRPVDHATQQRSLRRVDRSLNALGKLI
jgi:hypothetical protein